MLAWGTKNAGELLMDRAGQGRRHRERRAQADLIIVDGDPLADLTLLAKPEQALKAVIRDGVFVIDRLPPVSKRRAEVNRDLALNNWWG